VNVGLILGGGGVVGIAWEIGVMAGLREHAGFDPGAMSLIVGTSAGSVAGAQVALGHDLDELVARQQRARRSPRSQKSSPPRAPGAPSVVPNDIMRLMISGDAPMEERTIAIGKLAVDADVALGEAEYVESFRSLLGTDEWPEIDLRVTTAECETGRSILWSKADGIDLLRAVASSCAIPGWFPPVEFDGHRYIDAPRGGFYAPLVEEKDLDALLFIGPNGALPEGLRDNPEIDALAGRGLPVVQITGGAAITGAAVNLMDPEARGDAVDAGIDDGKANALAVAELLG
jgi:NTE family protein